MTSVERRLGAVGRQAMAKFSVPGVAVGIVAGDDEHGVSEGITCVDFPLEVDSRTMFQIGSTSRHPCDDDGKVAWMGHGGRIHTRDT